jgi:hypothetical protein
LTAPPSSLAPNDPQAFALAQVTVQLTAVLPPTVPAGYVAAAVKVAAAFTANDVGGVEMKTTAVGAGGEGGVDAVSSPEPPQPAISTTIKEDTIRCLMAFTPGLYFVRARFRVTCSETTRRLPSRRHTLGKGLSRLCQERLATRQVVRVRCARIVLALCAL